MKLSINSARVMTKVLILPFLLLMFTPDLLSQSKGEVSPSHYENRQIETGKSIKSQFPDEYSDLDGKNKISNRFKTDEFQNDIEQVRQKYYQALILIQKRDTARAARYFDSAIEKLNQLSGTPGIEESKDFTELAQSVIDDYENYVKSIEFLDENSPIFIIRELLSKEIEVIEPLDVTAKEIEDYKKSFKHSVNFPKLPKGPDSLIIPLDEHVTVERSIKFLTTGQGKKIFSRWLERSSKWFPMMKRIAVEEKIPMEIIYLSMIESGLNPTIVSSAKAMGLWQFMRSTGEMYNLNKNSSIFIDERREPEKATRAAMRHLNDLYKEFGDWYLALAAYNCGAGCVARSIRRTNKQNPNYWEVRDNLPRETRGYVPQYIAAAKIAMNPESFGFNLDSLEFHDEYKYETVPIDSAVNLSALAKAAELSLDSLKMFNTELLKECTPPDISPYYLKLPIGKKNIFAKNYPYLTDEEKTPFINHTVENKQSLNSIANKYKVSVSDIVAVNKLSGSKARLKKGQNIIVPLNGKYLKDFATDQAEKNEAEVNSSLNIVKKESVKHTVTKGETLFSIAKKYEMDVAELRRINDISENNQNLVAGRELWVKPIPGDLVVNNQNSDSRDISKLEKKEKLIKHKVKSGETLAQIADDYGVTIASIKENNKISNKNSIRKGQILKIISNENESVISSAPSSNKLTHTVRSGENLSTIAAKYGVTENELRNWNTQSIKGNTVYANTNLTIYTTIDSKGSNKANPPKVKNSPKYYKIRRGDTLSEIADKFGVSITSIKNLNKNIKENHLMVGKQIRIQ
jgi:membrane-bound lytic murein transglycosylase D